MEKQKILEIVANSNEFPHAGSKCIYKKLQTKKNYIKFSQKTINY